MVDAFGQWRPDFPGQHPFNDPAFVRTFGMPPQQAAKEQPQQETRMEVVPVGGEPDVDKLYVAAGAAKLAMAQDDSFVAVKAVSMAGQTSIVYFDRRPDPAPAPVFVPADYVRKDEIVAFVEAVLAAREGKNESV